ncbi:DGPFAETKE family protein [Caballeronia arvi]|uniref:DGPFAETKE family protein n=1 Tax=Caballeronia arvi TaxID=1777135 RepID=A0A158KCP6_9BURK|nr:YciI family protein [Caballeronia arvi]SAL78896.1 DGPFAETKE family protein [Caballeronia arvi]
MAYLLLVVEPVEQRGQRTEEEGREVYDQMVRFADGLNARGILRAVESLTSLKDASRVTASNGDARIIDGPFAEAKEMIGGFFLIDCETRAEAVEIAAQCPAAKWCTIEVRKVGPCYA